MAPTPNPTIPAAELLPSPHRVVSVHDSKANSWTGSGNPAAYMNQTEINNMVQQGVMELTGQATPQAAWQMLIPYQSGEGVAIKMNFNNVPNCDFTENANMNAYAAVANAVIQGLESIGVPADKIWITDPSRPINDYFRNGISDPNVQYYTKCSAADIGSRQNVFITGYIPETSPDATLFNPAYGLTDPYRYVLPAQVFENAAHIINIPQLKGHGSPPDVGGVTLGIKHHFGSVSLTETAEGDSPLHSNPYFFQMMGDISANPVFYNKTRLVIGDGIMGHPTLNYEDPVLWSTFGNKPPETFFFGADPVAVDSVMFDYIQAECTATSQPAREDNVLAYAASIGLGVLEHWNNDTQRQYTIIDYHEIDFDKGLQAATPSFSPAPGNYSSPQSVTLSDTTAGAVIYYTTDGSTPTTSSTLYSGSIAVSGTTTIKAIAVASGYLNSAVATGTYTLPATLVSIAVTPAYVSIPKGSTQQFTATGTYSDSSTQNLTSTVTWTSSNTAVATISTGGLATGAATGSATIQAISGSISGSTSLTVTRVLVSIAVTPANASIAKGVTQQFTATGVFSDASTANLTSLVTWSSTNTAVATIASGGLATGVAAGSTTIQAISGAIGGSTSLTVTAPVLVSIAVTPATTSLATGATQQFTATGTYSDSSTQNLTSSVTWTSTNTAVATITSGGLATGVAVGSTTIQATSGSISGSTSLTVTVSGLVGYWKFDDGSGTTAADSSGNGHPVTLVNGVSWVTGKIEGAISANGVNQYGSIPAIDLSGTSAVTVAMWVNRTYSTAGSDVWLEDSANFNSSTTGFGIFMDDPTCNGIQTGVHGDVGYNMNCYAQPSSAVWHHLAFIFDKSQPASNEVTLYVDGVLQTPTLNFYRNDNTNTFGNNPIYLFSRGGSQFFSAGEMDDLRLYNVALSASQIQQIYQAGSATVFLAPASAEYASIADGPAQQFIANTILGNDNLQNLTASLLSTSSKSWLIIFGGVLPTNSLVATFLRGNLPQKASFCNYTLSLPRSIVFG